MPEGAIGQDPLLEEMVTRLVAAFHPELIYLYGSRARGEASEDSDYDLMVVVRESDLSFRERWVKAFRLLCGLDASKEVIVLTSEEFKRKQEVVCSLPATVAREGEVVYAARKG